MDVLGIFIVLVYAFMFFVFAYLQIEVFNALPKFLRLLLLRTPIVIIVLNFWLSTKITEVAGQTHGMGAINMASSVAFALYVWYYKKYCTEEVEKEIKVAGKKVKYKVLKEKDFAYKRLKDVRL